MSAALRLVEPLPSTRPSMRPTLVPPRPPTAPPMSVAGVRATEPPTTQRSATVHPRVEAAARADAMNLIAVLRMNADFLGSLLRGNATPMALATLEELHVGIDRLEDRVAGSLAVGLPRVP